MRYSDKGLANKSLKWIVAGIFLLAIFLRISHNDAIMESPLYDHPVGGHTPYFALAKEISDGHLFTVAPLYTLSSPGYPYFVALIYKAVGFHHFFGLRMVTAFLDSISAVFLFLLVRRIYTFKIALAASVIYTILSPVIFFSVELTPVPFISFLLILSFLLWTYQESKFRRLMAMFILGLSCTLRPNLVLIFPFLLSLSYMKESRLGIQKYVGYILVGLLGILPITYVNYVHSGEFILLSTSGGHNLFIGHYEGSTAGYSLPVELDGDISENMKKMAESTLGQALTYTQASTFFAKTAFDNMKSHPYREVKLFFEKSLAFFNAYEATNYVDFYYQKKYSSVLRLLPDFGIFLAFMIFGIFALVKERDFLFLVPIAVCFISVVVFFFISRLRMPSSGFIAIVSTYGMVKWWAWMKEGTITRRWFLSGLTAVLLYMTMHVRKDIDTSNEQNKEALIWQYLENYDKAESGFKEAIATNPENIHPYQNLIVLYKKLGRDAESQNIRDDVNKILDKKSQSPLP